MDYKEQLRLCVVGTWCLSFAFASTWVYNILILMWLTLRIEPCHKQPLASMWQGQDGTFSFKEACNSHPNETTLSIKKHMPEN